MKKSPFYFEIKDMLTQFVAAFNDVVIERYNENKQPEDRIQVRYVYAPKQRVLYDIINLNKTITLPVISVTYSGISRDSTRVFNKLSDFEYFDGKDSFDKFKTPIPINLNINMSILARYQLDMDQILSNFVPFCNPYIVVSWKVPKDLGIQNDLEIRSEILWSGDVSLNFPTDQTAGEKARITADTSFTMKGWLFKDKIFETSKPIYYIDTNYYAMSSFKFVNYETTQKNLTTYPSDSFTLSGYPQVTDLYYDQFKIVENIVLNQNTMKSEFTLYGYNFDLLDGIVLSSNNDSIFNSLTGRQNFDDRFSSLSGIPIVDYNILGKNRLVVTLPTLSSSTLSTNLFTINPYNSIGFSSTDKTSQLSTSTFININNS